MIFLLQTSNGIRLVRMVLILAAAIALVEPFPSGAEPLAGLSSEDKERVTKTLAERVEKSKSPPADQEWKDLLTPYLHLPKEEDRVVLYYGLIAGLGRLPDGDARRQFFVGLIARGAADSSPFIKETVCDALLSLTPSDFSEDAKKLLLAEFQRNPTRKTMLIGGKLFYPSIAEKAKEISRNKIVKRGPQLHNSVEWAAQLVLARHQDKDAVQTVLRMVQGEPNEIACVTLLVPDLGYVPDPAIVAYLRSLVESKDRLPSVKPTVQGTLVAKYACVALAQVLDGFPAVDPDGGFSEADRLKCLQWLKTHPNLKFQEIS
jgi:hypothetical protein